MGVALVFGLVVWAMELAFLMRYMADGARGFAAFQAILLAVQSLNVAWIATMYFG
jgi:hypothetical protein